MDGIIGWPPVIWTARVLLVILLGSAAWFTALYFARFLRPKHCWRLITAELPVFRNVGGTAKVFGQEFAANATLETVWDREFRAVGERLAVLEKQFDERDAVDQKALKGTEARERQ